MRLHRLELTAFGPFAGAETVDFDALAEEGLHLIQGPTGAGKSSILDAICFALFAAVPNHRGTKGSLPSHHADAGAVPKVVLELTAAGRRLRITRSPGFSRPKKRGTGETTVQPSVLLQERLDGEWVSKGSRIDEVAQVVDDVIGLGLEQFVKVVLLPQGEFAAFLRATPEDRRGLLERLFDTSRFTDIEDWLVSRRRESGEALARTRERLHRALQRVDDELAGLGLGVGATESEADADAQPGSGPEPSWPGCSQVAPDEVRLELARIRAQVDDVAARALADSDAADTRATAAVRSLERGRRTAQLRTEGRAAQLELDGLAELAPQIARQRDRVERALRSRAVAAHLEGADAAAQDLARLEQEIASARAIVSRCCRVAIMAADSPAAQVRTLADQVRDATSALTRAADALQRARAAKATQQTAEREAEDVAQQVIEMLAAQEDRAARRRDLERDVEQLVGLAGQRSDRQHQLARLEQAARLRDELSDLSAHEERLATRERRCTATWRDAEQFVLRLRAARLDDLAGELADRLADGEPCPVCGSAEHPAPALRRTCDLDTGEEAIEAAETAAGVARESLEQVRSGLAGARTRIEERTDQLEGCLAATETSAAVPVDELADVMARARAELDASAEAERRLPRLRQTVADLADAEERSRTSLLDLREQQATARSRAQSARTDKETARCQLEQLLRSHADECPCGNGPVDAQADVASPDEIRRWDVDEVATAHRRSRERLEELATLLRDRDAAEERLAVLVAQRGAALAEHGFTDAEEARDAQLPDVEVASLQAQLAEVERRRVAAQAQLERTEVQAALAADEPDVEALERDAQVCRERQRTADQAQSHAERAVQQLARLAEDLHETLDELGPAESEHRALLELADCVAGTGQDNTLRMRLSSYVLAARLEEVARYANERLAVMSEGRYSLQHTDARAARGARGGLGLNVTDAWTGVARDTSSLSGGESFMAALALALGLGDAVKAEAGGLDLQTLFIDEGFGSLDEDSLEQVMGVLDDLREGGRCVGIVSHVAELRQRIRAQVLVTKTTAGSHVRVRTGVEDEAAA